MHFPTYIILTAPKTILDVFSDVIVSAYRIHHTIRMVHLAGNGILNTFTNESMAGNPYSQLRLGWGVEHSPFKVITWYTGAKTMGLRMADALIARVNYGLSRPGT